MAIPGATQNEIEIEDAKKLVKKGVKVVLEGANMPSTSEAIDHFHEHKVVFAAAKVRRPTRVLTKCCMLGRDGGHAFAVGSDGRELGSAAWAA